MKKLLVLIFFLSALYINASTTAVTTTLTDADGQVWANCTVVAQFVPLSTFAGPYLMNGSSFTQTVSATCNSSGVFTMTLTDVNTINPTGTHWQFTLCSNTNSQCVQTGPVVVTGVTQNLSTTLSATLGQPRVNGVLFPRAYTDTEINNPQAGTTYWNVLTNAVRTWNGSSWIIPGTTVPGSPNTSVQTNQGGVFTGNTNFNWDNTTERLSIGAASSPDHKVHIVGSVTNDLVGIHSTATDSASMFHLDNQTVQGPFMDFQAATQRWAFGIGSAGNFDLRTSTGATDPVNGTTIFRSQPTGNWNFTGAINSCTSAGASGTAYTCATALTFTPQVGTRLTFFPDVDSGVNPTLAINSTTARSIYRQGGQTQVTTGEIKANKPVILTYDAANHWDVGDLNVSSGAAFNAITGGTNTTAAMIVGAGASLYAGPASSTFDSSISGLDFAAPLLQSWNLNNATTPLGFLGVAQGGDTSSFINGLWGIALNVNTSNSGIIPTAVLAYSYGKPSLNKTLDSVYGVDSNVFNVGRGIIDSVISFHGNPPTNSGGGIINNNSGIRIESVGISGAINSAAIDIAAQNNGVNDYVIKSSTGKSIIRAIQTGVSTNQEMAGQLTLTAGTKTQASAGLYVSPLICVSSSTAATPLAAQTVSTLASTGGIKTSTLNAGGANYAVGNRGTINGGSATYEVLTLSGSAVATYVLISADVTGYAVGAAVATTASTGIGTGFKVNITQIAAVNTLTLTVPGGANTDTYNYICIGRD